MFRFSSSGNGIKKGDGSVIHLLDSKVKGRSFIEYNKGPGQLSLILNTIY